MTHVYYVSRGILWILPPKCASSSIKTTIGLDRDYLSAEEAIALNRTTPTVGVVRHPYDRAVSALFTALMDVGDFETRLRASLTDIHVRPQYPAFEPMRVDHLLCFDKIEQDWKKLQMWFPLPDLVRENVGPKNGRVSWRDFDWSEFRELFARDVTLWEIALQR